MTPAALGPRRRRAQGLAGGRAGGSTPARIIASALAAPVAIADRRAADSSPLRHEYVGGCLYAMTGATMRHNRIAGTIHAALLARLAGTPCQPIIGDMRLHVRAADGVYYPDVVCGRGVVGTQRMVFDATLIVEVLAPQTFTEDAPELPGVAMALVSLDTGTDLA